MKIDVLLGLQWGDEGKGKIVDVLTPHYDIIARFQGGPNAGHTLEFNGEKHILHTIPSGIFHTSTINIIGNGVIIDPVIFEQEINRIRKFGIEPKHNLKISRKAHLILPAHRLIDAVQEKSRGNNKIGSTLKGIGPAYTDKTARNGTRVMDLSRHDFKTLYNEKRKNHLNLIRAMGFSPSEFLIEKVSFDDYETKWFSSLSCLKEMELIDCEYYLNDALNSGKKVLAEGAQGSMLDIDHGSYPFVTSSNTTTSGVCSGLGLAPSRIGKVIGIFKAYATRVGSGPFPTELNDETGERMRKAGNEFGSTTGRPRRCGWLDIPALNYANMLNGTTHLIMTKADVLSNFRFIRIATAYKHNDIFTQSVNQAAFNTDCEPVYSEHQAWKKRIEELNDIARIPPQLEDFILGIEQLTHLPVNIVSTGPDRKQILIRKPFF